MLITLDISQALKYQELKNIFTVIIDIRLKLDMIFKEK